MTRSDQVDAPGDALQSGRKLNVLIFFWNPALWNTALSLISPITIMPLFVSMLTTSTILVGLAASFFDGAWALTQLFGTRYFEQIRFKRNRMVAISMASRSMIVLYGLYLIVTGAENTKLTLALFFLMILLFRGGTGITAPAYADVFAKVIDRRMRGRIIGISQAVGVLLGAVGVTVAGRILGDAATPAAFGPLILVAGSMLTLGYSAMLRLTEPPSEVPDRPREPIWRLAGRIRRVYRSDPVFRQYVTGRLALGWGMMGITLLAVYAARNFGATVPQIGLFTSVMLVTQIAALAGWGIVQDRLGNRYVSVFGGVAAMFAIGLAVIAPNTATIYGTFVLVGIATSAFSVSDFATVIGLAPTAELPSYWAAFNTTLFLLVLPAGMVAGLFVDLAGFKTMYIMSLAFASLGVFLLAHKTRAR